MSSENQQSHQAVYINFNTQRNPPSINAIPRPPASLEVLGVESHEQLLNAQGPASIINLPIINNQINLEPANNQAPNQQQLAIDANPANNNSQEYNVNDRLLQEQKIYKGWIFEFLLCSCFSHAFAILFVLFFLIKIKYIYLFIPLFLWDIYDLWLILKRIKSRNIRFILYNDV